MARDRDDDSRDSRDDSRDDRPRRRRDDDAPKKGGKGWLIALIIVGGVLLVCGGIIGGIVYVAMQAVAAVTQAVEQVGGSLQATGEGTTFLNTIRTSPDAAYDRTSDNFKKTTTKEQFAKLVKAHPVLSEENYFNQGQLPPPQGTSPNRKLTLTYTVNPGVDPNPTGTTSTGTGKTTATGTKPTVPPTTPSTTPKTKSATVTLTMAEQPDKTWKVDGFTAQ